jgi:hypothetical protein
VHVEAGAHQLGGDVRLQVGEAQHQVRRELDDACGACAGEGGHPRLLAPGARRTDGESGDTDDAPLLAEEIERLGRLLGEAHDPLRIS